MMGEPARLFRIFCGFVVVGALGAAAVFVYCDTRSPISIALFKAGYSLTPSKYYYLMFYSPARRDVSAGYLPPEGDDFLCERIEDPESDDEFAAIVNLYSIQAGGREGSCIYATSDDVREKIAQNLISHLDGEPGDVYRRIILLEEVRLGKSLGKGNIGPSSISTAQPATPEEWKAWTEGTGLPIATKKYREWWRSDSNWNNKKTIDPLDGMEVRVNSCCG